MAEERQHDAGQEDKRVDEVHKREQKSMMMKSWANLARDQRLIRPWILNPSEEEEHIQETRNQGDEENDDCGGVISYMRPEIDKPDLRDIQ